MSNVKLISINPVIDKLKLYEIQYTMVNKNSRDTIASTFMYNTVIKEDNKWKII